MIPVPQPALAQLARAFGTSAGELVPFGGGHEASDGVVYSFPHQDRRRLLKILALPAGDQGLGLACLVERLRFVRYLGEHGAPITFPQVSPRQNLYETVPTDDHRWVAYSMEIAPGRRPDPRTWDPDLYRAWGQTLGLLHRLARSYPTWPACVHAETGQEFLTWRQEWAEMHRRCPDPEVQRCWEAIREELEGLPVTREVYGLTHNDPHLGNAVVDRGRITLLDFDVANHHWFASDLAIACQSVLASRTGGMGAPLRDPERLREFLALFLEGYEQEHSLVPEWLNRLDLFLAYRRILLFTVMQGWISSRPALHASWRKMILTRPPVVGDLRDQRAPP